MIPLLKTAYVDLSRNKLRTILTSLGILIGVFSVIVLIAVGLGFRIFIEDSFNSLGTNLVVVFPGNIFSDEGGFQDSEGGFGTTSFDERDVKNIEKLRGAMYVVPTFAKTTLVKARSESEITDIFASPPEIFTIRTLEAEFGKLFTEADNRKRAKIAVLGPGIAEDLFGSGRAAVGQTIRIEGLRYKVAGVLKPKGGSSFGGPNFDAFTYLPFNSTFSLNPDSDILGIYIQAEDQDVIPALKTAIQEEMLERYDDEEFSVIEQTQILETVTTIFGVINSVLVAIGAVSLVVGGVGIMNIMYASVSARVKEIGIRRSIGATKNDILAQFLFEAVLLSLLGGLLGLTLAAVGVEVAQRWFPARLNLLAVLVAIGVSTAIGLFFGAWPARQAAKLTPIEAIRKR